MKFLLPLLFSLILPSIAHAEITRWVDSQGRVHYSDGPPPAGAKSSKTIDTPASAATPAGDAKKTQSWQEKDMEFRQRKASQAEAQAKKDEEAAKAKEKKQNCEGARTSLRSLESEGRVSTTNEKGERVIMDDAARAKAIEEARKAVESWCK